MRDVELDTFTTAPAAIARAGAATLKRGALRVFDALMPRGE